MVKRIRAIYERWPIFRERLPDVWAALRDTSVPASSRFIRTWRIVDRHLLDRPEWLSSRTESLRDIRYRREKAERTTVAENFHRRLHELHTIGRSSALGASVFAVAVGLSVAGGLALAGAAVSDRVSGLAETLVAIANVVGGAAGILFAVIVFGIQYHGEKLDKAAFLVRYLRRREGLIPIAAFTLGVVAANVVVSLICSLGLSHAAVPMAILDVPLVLAVLWLVLWLLYRMTASVSDDFVTLLTPSLTWEYDRELDQEIHDARQNKVFEEVVEDAGLGRSKLGGFASLDRIGFVKLKLAGRGRVADVNLTALRALGNLIRSACPDHDAKLCIGPGDSVDNTVALVLSASRDRQNRQKHDVAAPGELFVEGLRRRLRAVFRLGSVRRRDVIEVFSRFESVVVSYARHDSAEQLERGLEIQETLVKRGLARADAVPTGFSIHRERLPDFLAGFSYFDMARHAVASGDREKVSVLLDFSCQMMALAIQHEHPSLYHRAGEIVEATYFRAIQSKNLADYVGQELDRWLNALGSQFEYADSWRRRYPEKIAAQMPVLIADLGWRLRLMKAAMEAGRADDATNFQDRLFRWDRHSTKRFARPDTEGSAPPELREVYDVLSYATLIVAAWCLYLAERQDKHTETTTAVFQRCAGDLGGREDLMRLWETVRSQSFTGRLLDDPFGVVRWTIPSPGRAGVSVGCQVSDAWIERGFIALLLARPALPPYDIPDSLRACPPFRPKSPDEVKTLTDSILDNDAVRKELLNIGNEKRDETATAVVALLAGRLRLFKLDRLAAVTSAPLRDEHRSQLHSQIAKKLEEKHGLIDMLQRLGGLPSEARSWFWPRIEIHCGLPKGSIVHPSEWMGDSAPQVAQVIQSRENMQAVFMAETIAEPTTTVARLAELADAVRDAAARLRRLTPNPVFMFIPQDRRVSEALVGRGLWQLPKSRAHGDCHLGDWEGCHLAYFPYPACHSVLLVDVLAFYGWIPGDAASRLDLDLEHAEKRKHDDWVQKARSETNPARIPESNDVKILAVARFSSGVGLHDPNAAIRVDLDLTRIGCAVVKGEAVYHRPDCSLLSAVKGEIVYTLAHHLPSEHGSRSPCEHCRPDVWKEQPSEETRKAIAVE